MDNLDLIQQALPYLLEGTVVTIELTFWSLLIGIVIGLPLAFGQVYGNKALKFVIAIYERLARSIPLLVMLLLLNYGLPRLGLRIPVFRAAVIGIGLRSAAYQSQIYRGAIQSVGGSQLKAALSLGMSRFKAFFYIIAPQAIRIAIPPVANESAIVLKDTSLAFTIGVVELLRQGEYYIATSNKPMVIYLTVAFIYFVLTTLVNGGLSLFERKYQIPGIGIEGGHSDAY
ncbi:amino acid ABC transporter permease [Halanaerobium salsuginis]|jgi:polar amino acid transport system permease protein|uniref:Amino acid ABC transporter membrane protein 1, PAAT family n=1 Tax=Halanaerobium salsuginis TaxID=29563 RepID=A0A1I4G0C3_9FIRM|nr:amino acid ABC transporter permease [Halanaerobium salsuginis]SFL23153.1 amino acid ABC transporter membrane protein 1, PAAT family [Halanaerobium salsuginis]